MSNTPKFENFAREVCDRKGFSLKNFEGSGTFKETYKVSDDADNILALKIFDPSKIDLQRTEREIESIKKCDHDSICELYEFDYIDINQTQVYYALEEFMYGGALTDKLKKGKVSDIDSIELGIRLVDSLEHLKKIGLVHRDIKPDNIMYRKPNSSIPVLVDFGLVRVLGEKSLTPSFLMQGPGTPIFSAPEQLNNDKSLIDWKTDQFSLGVVLSYCFLGLHPFKDKNENPSKIVNRIQNRDKPVKSFITRANKSGVGYLIKMVEAWPHRRFQNISDLRTAINN